MILKVAIIVVFIIAMFISAIGGVSEKDAKFRDKLLVLTAFFAGLIVFMYLKG